MENQANTDRPNRRQFLETILVGGIGLVLTGCTASRSNTYNRENAYQELSERMPYTWEKFSETQRQQFISKLNTLDKTEREFIIGAYESPFDAYWVLDSRDKEEEYKFQMGRFWNDTKGFKEEGRKKMVEKFPWISEKEKQEIRQEFPWINPENIGSSDSLVIYGLKKRQFPLRKYYNGVASKEKLEAEKSMLKFLKRK